MSNERDAEVILTANTAQYNKSVEESSKITDKLVKSLEKTSESATKITKATSKGLLKIGAAEVAGLTALSAVAATLEKQTSNIQSNLALNKSTSQYNAVTGAIRSMSREMPLARAEIALMATAVSDLGMVTAKQVGGVSTTFNKMGIATGESSVGLANSMVQFQRAMGVAQPTFQTMDPYANSVTGLSARAGTSAQGIMGFAQSFAPAARVAGLNQSSVLGLSTAATRAGVDGQYAASTISQILNDITQLRYVNSPELGRYARALGMDSAELTRKTTGPEDQDKFLRNIMSRVVSVAQTEEGPSRLSMMNIDGLRARKALQGLASDPGGIEKWINQAQAGMTQPNVQTGFKAASSGLADQTTMLRNRATDVGQQLGTPVMEALNGVAIGANKLAAAFEPLTNLMTGFIGKIGIPLGAMTMAAGVMYKMWSTLSTLNLAQRTMFSTGTSAFANAAQDARGIASGAINGNAASLSAWGQRISDPNAKTSATQRTMYRLGGAIGSATSNWDRPTGLGQMFLQGVDRTRQWTQRTTLDMYEKGRLGTQDRYDAKLQQERLTDQYKRQRSGLGSASSIYPVGFQPAVPHDPRTGRPLAYVAPESGRYTVGGVARGLGSAYVQIPGEAAYSGGVFGGRAIRGLGSHFIKEPWQEMRANQQSMGYGPWAAQGAGRIGSGLSSGIGTVGSMAASPMGISMAAMAGISALVGARGEYTDWKKKWDPESGGISAGALDNLSEYNEKLGLATRSLQQFTKGLDESNPARSDNINAELSNAGNVRDFGRNMDELVNERLSAVKTAEQAKEWISSQGTMNADQWVLVMRDFSKVFKNNTAAFTELNKWVIDNQKGGSVPIEGIGTPELTNKFEESAQGSGWRKILGLGGTFTAFGNPIASAVGAVSGGDYTNIRGNKDFQNSSEFLTGSQASQAKTIGEKKDASSLFGDAKPNITQQEALTRGEGISQFVATANEMMQDVRNAVNPTEINRRRIILDEYMKAGASTFGFGTEGWNATAVAADQFGSEQSNRRRWNEDIEKQIKEGAANGDEKLQMLIDSGALPKIMAGKSLSDQLPNLTVQTSSQQAVAGTSFAQVDEKTFEKYLGEGSLLGKGLLAAGTLSDTTDFENASSQLLEFAKKIDKTSRRYAGPNFETLKGEDLGKQYAILEEMKINNQEGTQGWNLAKAAQAKIQVQTQFNDVGKTSLEVRQRELSDVRDLLPGLNVDPNKQSQDLLPQLNAAKVKAQSDKQALAENVTAWGVTRAREDAAWQKNSGRSWAEYYRQREYSQDDFQRSAKRSQDSFNRQMANSEAAFQRSLKYQRQDFNRSRDREEEAYKRQKKYAAEDTAKGIGDPYNRVQLQLLSDPRALASNMENRARLAELHNKNIEKLKGMGLSEPAMQQLNVNDFNNSQQVDYMTKDMTPEMIDRLNTVAARLVGASGKLNETDTSTIRAEEERDIGLKQSFDDFFRNLKRTKIEHAIQVNFSKSEFAISMKSAEEEHKISLKRSAEAQNRIMSQAAEDRATALRQQTEDLFGFGTKGIESMERTTGKILGKDGIISTFGGDLKSELRDVYSTTSDIITSIDEAIAKLGALRKKQEAANAKAETDRENNRATAQQQESQDRIDKASKVGWIENPPKRSASGAYLVWSPIDKKYVDVRTWQNQYKGFQTATLAEGGILKARAGGRLAIMAEAGSDEMAIPLNARGIDFMSQFTKGVAAQMVQSMPRTPVSAQNTINQYDHSTTVQIESVSVASNDPKKFIKELQLESQKKRAALYKS